MVILCQFSTSLFVWVSIFLAVCGVLIGLLFRYILKLNARSNLLSRELNTAFVESLNGALDSRAACGAAGRELCGPDHALLRMLFKIDAMRAE